MSGRRSRRVLIGGLGVLLDGESDDRCSGYYMIGLVTLGADVGAE